MLFLKKHYFFSLTFILLLIALIIRLIDLDQRPMHGDEAVNAYKLGELMEDPVFRYDPEEYHGPALYYFSLAYNMLQGRDTYADLVEENVRAVPVFFSMVLLVLWVSFHNFIGRNVTLLTLFLLGISSPVLFYSRYYIHEMLFSFSVYLTLFFAYRLYKKPGIWPASLFGIAAGLAIATKETWMIVLPLIFIVFFIFYYFLPSSRAKWNLLIWHKKAFYPGLVIFFLVLTVLIFYTAGFSNISAASDVFKAIPYYLERGTEASVHAHPWYEYVRWLFFYRTFDGILWSEGFLLFCALAGGFFLLRDTNPIKGDRNFLLLLAIFSFLQFVMFSALSYKTPWNLLAFYPGMLTLAAFGIVSAFKNSRKLKTRIILVILVTVGGIHILGQSIALNYRYESDPRNPFVYAHPLPDILKLTDRLQDLGSELPEGLDTPIQVIVPGDDYWPLPWYLRCFRNVGWWDQIPEEDMPAPIIITSSDMDPLILSFLYERPPPGYRHLYVPLFQQDIAMRPDRFLNVYIRYALHPGEDSL